MTCKIFILLALAAMVSASCAQNISGSGPAANDVAINQAAPSRGGEGVGALVPMDNSIRKVDFKNFTYEPHCAGEETEKVTVKNGEFSKETKDKDSDFVDRFYFGLFGDITYGDLDGDNKEEAVIMTNCNTGGTGQFSEGFVYTIKTGKPTLLARFEGGDRAYGGLRSAKVENGLLVVDQNDAGEGGASCCAEYSVVTRYKWDGKQLKVSKTDPRKELYPSERVSFEKGSTKTSVKISVDEVKRYVLGARAGQTLSVSVNNPNVTVSLIKGEADSTEGQNGFTARLKENGDFTIQLQNIDDKPADVTLTIEIK